jgi:hypothetical protein
MNTLEFDRLLFRLKKAKTNSEKAELYASLSAEARELALAIKEKNITAIKYIMDRIDGKPTESIELTDGAVDQQLREIMNGSK